MIDTTILTQNLLEYGNVEVCRYNSTNEFLHIKISNVTLSKQDLDINLDNLILNNFISKIESSLTNSIYTVTYINL